MRNSSIFHVEKTLAMSQGFNDHFKGRTSVLQRRKLFYEAKQGPQGSITGFACRLRRLVSDCDLGKTGSTHLRDIFVIGVADDRIGERLFAEDAKSLTFELAIARGFERAKERSRTIAAIRSIPGQFLKPRTVADEQ